MVGCDANVVQIKGMLDRFESENPTHLDIDTHHLLILLDGLLNMVLMRNANTEREVTLNDVDVLLANRVDHWYEQHSIASRQGDTDSSSRYLRYYEEADHCRREVARLNLAKKT